MYSYSGTGQTGGRDVSSVNTLSDNPGALFSGSAFRIFKASSPVPAGSAVCGFGKLPLTRSAASSAAHAVRPAAKTAAAVHSATAINCRAVRFCGANTASIRLRSSPAGLAKALANPAARTSAAAHSIAAQYSLRCAPSSIRATARSQPNSQASLIIRRSSHAAGLNQCTTHTACAASLYTRCPRRRCMHSCRRAYSSVSPAAQSAGR